MSEYQDRFQEAGANLVVIGNGKPEDISPLAEDTGFKGTIAADPGLETYRALGFHRSVSGLLSMGAVLAGFKAFGAGYRPASLQGDALQLGGAAVIGSGPSLHYLFRSEKAANHPQVSDILEACLQA